MAHYVQYQYLPVEGAELFTVVCLPEHRGSFPTVILRSPYVDDCQNMTEEEICAKELADQKVWLDKGYAVVDQHCRGRGKSTGDCIPYINERADGLALQAWIRQQSFYNGELFLFGASYTSSVHYVTAPFASDIKGAILKVQDSERYNANYRNGFYKIGLHGNWYVEMYKKKTMPDKPYTKESYHMLPLAEFSRKVLGEPVESFDQILMHPDRNDPFWQTHNGGADGRDALKHANIPILLITGFYDIYTGGIFDMWNSLDDQTRAKSALVVHPYGHSGMAAGQPLEFPKGTVAEGFGNYPIDWMEAIRGKGEFPVKPGKVSYYQLFDNQWYCDDFAPGENVLTLPLGEGEKTYRYDPNNPASFPGGLSANFGGAAWQDPPNLRQDVISVYTPEFQEDTYVKGKIGAKLLARSNCEDTCFYVRISLVKQEGDYGLRDDIQQISNFRADYIPAETVELTFSFDEHAFMIQKGEKLRIDISSSAFPHYVRHTNYRGLFSEQTQTQVAENTIVLDQSQIIIPIQG